MRKKLATSNSEFQVDHMKTMERLRKLSMKSRDVAMKRTNLFEVPQPVVKVPNRRIWDPYDDKFDVEDFKRKMKAMISNDQKRVEERYISVIMRYRLTQGKLRGMPPLYKQAYSDYWINVYKV